MQLVAPFFLEFNGDGDALHIKAWDTYGDYVVTESQMGGSDDSYAGTELGGNITVSAE